MNDAIVHFVTVQVYQTYNLILIGDSDHHVDQPLSTRIVLVVDRSGLIDHDRLRATDLLLHLGDVNREHLLIIPPFSPIRRPVRLVECEDVDNFVTGIEICVLISRTGEPIHDE